MATCTKCGAALADNAAFCASCGTRVEASAGPGPAAPPTATVSSAGIPFNIAALLCYVFWPITCILFLLIEPYNRDKLVRFHAFQSLFLGLCSFGLAIALMILTTVLALIPIVGWILNILIWLVFGLGVFVLVIFLIYKAYSGEQYRVPWVGQLAAQQAEKTA